MASQLNGSMAKDTKELHIVMLPWLAFGHMIPFYQFATSLAKKGVKVSYISTPRNINRLPKIPSELASHFEYITLPMPKLPDGYLPQQAEATVDVEFDQIPHLKLAYDLLHDPIQSFVMSQCPDWIICDIISYWMPDVAKNCRARLMHFSVYTATLLCFVGPVEYLSEDGYMKVRPTPDCLTKVPPWGGHLDPSVVFHGYEAARFYVGFYRKNPSGISDAERIATILKGCDAVAVRSCREFEKDSIELYQKLVRKPVVPVGLLPPVEPHEGDRYMDGEFDKVFKWLDQQKRRSVVYVGFGSEYKLTKDEVYEIAYGLELAELPFLWGLRKPTWAMNDSESLPSGFVTRTSGKGIVCLGWVPQLKILAHPSIGSSMFHSGWGSIIETLQHGHSLILLPCIVDQGLNARMMVEKGLGIEVDRREDGSFTREDIACALKQAMLGDEAHKIRVEAMKAAAVFGDQKLHQEGYISRVLEFLRYESR
ncbi:unnamed protein product [Amaranthus hypochondriacus]